MKYWLPVLLVAAGTYLYRYSFIGGKMKFPMPALLKEALAFVPVSVMASLVALGFFIDKEGHIFFYWPNILAALAAAFMALRFKRDLLTIIMGLAVFWLADALLS